MWVLGDATFGVFAFEDAAFGVTVFSDFAAEDADWANRAALLCLASSSKPADIFSATHEINEVKFHFTTISYEFVSGYSTASMAGSEQHLACVPQLTHAGS